MPDAQGMPPMYVSRASGIGTQQYVLAYSTKSYVGSSHAAVYPNQLA